MIGSSFECPWCDPDDYTVNKFFGSTDELASHRDVEHPNKPIFVCSACDKTFGKYHEATDHVLDAHDEFCDECQKSYIYEILVLTPEAKERISKIHTKIAELREELEIICRFPKSEGSEIIG